MTTDLLRACRHRLGSRLRLGHSDGTCEMTVERDDEAYQHQTEQQKRKTRKGERLQSGRGARATWHGVRDRTTYKQVKHHQGGRRG